MHARTVCWSTQYASAILPDDKVQELRDDFNVGHYDTEQGEVCVKVKVDKITTNKEKLKAALEVSCQPTGCMHVCMSALQ
jgi:hypothetical protein